MAHEASTLAAHQRIGCVSCRECGTWMRPNNANMCAKCFLSEEVDIREGLIKRLRLYHCPHCDRYFQPPISWLMLQPESKELRQFCLERLDSNLGSDKVTIFHDEIVWTKPMKVKVVVREKVPGGVVDHLYAVEYDQQEYLCHSCYKSRHNAGEWVVAVKIVQKASCSRASLQLAHLIRVHAAAAAADAVRIERVHGGVDFFFAHLPHGIKFLEFVKKVAPVTDRRVGKQRYYEPKSKSYKLRHAFGVDIFPICPDDLVLLPPKAAARLGNLGPLVICTEVSTSRSIGFFDPFTMRHSCLDVAEYWREPFIPLLTSMQLVEYTVLDVKVPRHVRKNVVVRVAPVSDSGKNGKIFSITTHLDRFLRPGDHALGYDLYAIDGEDDEDDIELEKYWSIRPTLPDVVLIKKCCEEEPCDKGNRLEQDKKNTEQFLKYLILEENPDLRSSISSWPNRESQPSEMAPPTDGEEVPSVPLEEALAELDLSDEEDKE